VPQHFVCRKYFDGGKNFLDESRGRLKKVQFFAKTAIKKIPLAVAL